MVFPFAAAAGAVIGSGIDFFNSDRAAKRQARILAEIRAISQDQLKVNEDHFQAAFPHLKATIATAKEYGERALRMNTQAGATASRLVGDQAQRAVRENRAEMTRRGLASTTRTASATAGILRGAGRAFGEIGERVGARNAAIVQGTGDRVAQGQASLADMILGKGNRDVAIRGDLASQLGNVQYEAQGGTAYGLGKLGGELDLMFRDAWSKKK